MRQLAVANEPQIREAQNLIDAFRAANPFFSGKVPYARTLFGNKVERGSGFDGNFGYLWNLTSPINIKFTPDKVERDIYREIIRVEVELGERIQACIPWVVGRITLEARERDRLAVIMGKETFDGFGRDLKQALNDLIHDELAYVGKAPGMQKASIEVVINSYKESAKLQVQAEFPELEEAVQERQRRRLQATQPRGIR